MIKNPTWSDNEITFLKDNFNSMSYKQIGQYLKRSEESIGTKCYELMLVKKEPIWTEYEIEYIKQNYMEMKTKDIAKHLNRTPSAIELKASRLGKKKYAYTCDYHYFDTIDTEEKAYWLGFLFADGWISKNDKSNAGVVGCELQYGDIEHLRKLNKSISGNYNIIDKWKACNISTKDQTKRHHICCLRIFSLVMYNSLVQLGFSNNKSYDANIPQIPEKLLRHFLRGYFDGDGCFTKTNKTFKVNFVTVSKSLNDDLIKLIKRIGISVNERTYINEYGNETYVPSINKYDDKIKLLDYMYSDANIYLNRKYKKYLKVKTDHKNTHAVPRLTEM